MKILSFGEILWDVYPDSKAIGGASLNLAAHLALMGAESYLVSAIGEDELGEEALSVAEALNIRCDYIKALSDKETGAVVVTLNSDGVPSYEIKDNVAYDLIPEPDIKDGEFEVLTFGTLAFRHTENRDAIKRLLSSIRFNEIYSDLNIRLPHSTKESAELCLENATIIKISDEELPYISEWIFGSIYGSEDFALKISEKYENIKLIIITKGADGSFALDTATKSFHYADAIPVSVVSTVGAGDSFGAAFLTRYLGGESIDSALIFASKISAFVCSRKEAVPDTSAFL